MNGPIAARQVALPLQQGKQRQQKHRDAEGMPDGEPKKQMDNAASHSGAFCAHSRGWMMHVLRHRLQHDDNHAVFDLNA